MRKLFDWKIRNRETDIENFTRKRRDCVVFTHEKMRKLFFFEYLKTEKFIFEYWTRERRDSIFFTYKKWEDYYLIENIETEKLILKI